MPMLTISGLHSRLLMTFSMPKGRPSDSEKESAKIKTGGKRTFVSLLGLDGARQQAKLLAEQAATHLLPFGPRAELLRDLATFVISRRT